jgi:pyrimidine operon attenuation protein/uracil phosphoribosyltransferase
MFHLTAGHAKVLILIDDILFLGASLRFC